MLNLTNEYNKFIKKWQKNLPNKQVLTDYIPLCSNLLYQKEDLVTDVLEILIKNIKIWAQLKSKVYKNEEIVSKDNLLEKQKWFVEELENESKKMRTSGSTTSVPFYYLRWDKFLYFIECENHYDLILDEFDIKNNFNLLYFFNNNSYNKNKNFSVKIMPKNFMECHGQKRNATCHYVNFNLLQKSYPTYYKKILNYCVDKKIDVIFCPGSVTNSLCHHIRKFKLNDKICSLLSNSYEEILHKDISYLLSNNLVDNICNHMRCWDGGATFFTCKYDNYHLLDNLSWCYEYEKKLISTDYFSFPSPFVNYWNGDFCEIEKNYKRCQCGRLYRPFKFLRSRPFAVKGNSIKDISDKLLILGIEDIKQIKCMENSITLITSKPISEDKKEKVKEKFKIKFNFILEN
jgi:hypothetical protein